MAERACASLSESLAAEPLIEALYAQAPVVLLVVDRAGRIARMNAFAQGALCPEGNPVGAQLRDALPDLAPRLESLLGRVFAADQAELNQPIAYDGRTWACSALPVREAKGATAWVQLLLVEAAPVAGATAEGAECSRAAAALRESEERLAAATASGSGTYRCYVDEDQHELDAATMRLWDLPVGTPVTMEALLERIHPQDRARFLDTIEQAVAGGEGMDLEFRIVRSTGEVRWIADQGRVVRDADGSPRYIMGSCRDITEQKRTEQALLRERELQQQIFEHLPVMITVWNPATKVLDVNKAFERVTGWRQQDLPDVDLMEECYPDPAYREEVRDYMLSLQQGWRDMQLTTRDGTVIDTSWTNFRLGDDTHIGIGLDISARKQAEEALRRSEREYRALFDLAGSGKAELDPATGAILRVNPKLCQFLGCGEEELLGVTPQHITHPDDRCVAADIVASIRRGEGRDWQIENRYLRKDGSTVWAFTTVGTIVDAQGHTGRAIMTLHDISDRKCIEQALRDSEEKLRVALMNSPMVVYRCDTELRYTWVGRTAGSTTTVALLGKRDDEVLPVGEAAPLMKVKRRALSSGHRVRQEVSLHLGGTCKTYDVTAEPLCDDAGKVTGLTVAAVDITERKQAEAALLEADRRKDEFLAMLAHELRNPLAPIRNVVELLKLQDDSDPTKVAWALDIVDRQTHQLTRIVDDLLDVARITNGRIRLQLSRLDLRGVVDNAYRSAYSRGEARGLRLVLELPAQAVMVNADGARLGQVVDNLLDNAIKFTEPGGQVRLALRREGEEALLAVSDSGIGIDPGRLPYIFDLFGQAHSSLDRAQGGLGLGLTLVQRLVELHGGTVVARSDGRGTGAEFVIRLPAVGAADDVPGPVAEGGASETSRGRVLVVEDNPDVADSLVMLLRAIGYQVECVADGEQGLEMVGAFDPQAVILDIGLPGMDGYQVARALRRGHPGLRLLALSGYGQDEDKRRSVEAGFDAHLVKPADVASLERALRLEG